MRVTLRGNLCNSGIRGRTCTQDTGRGPASHRYIALRQALRQTPNAVSKDRKGRSTPFRTLGRGRRPHVAPTRAMKRGQHHVPPMAGATSGRGGGRSGARWQLPTESPRTSDSAGPHRTRVPTPRSESARAQAGAGDHGAAWSAAAGPGHGPSGRQQRAGDRAEPPARRTPRGRGEGRRGTRQPHARAPEPCEDPRGQLRVASFRLLQVQEQTKLAHDARAQTAASGGWARAGGLESAFRGDGGASRPARGDDLAGVWVPRNSPRLAFEPAR